MKTYFESEVNRVYPDAWLCQSYTLKSWYWIVVPVTIFGIKIPSFIFERPISGAETVDKAWEYAYRQLVKKEKIKP